MKTCISRITCVAIVLTSLCISSCSHNPEVLTQRQRSIVTDSVNQMMASAESAVSRDGPVAWLRYFSGAPDFFMASDGQIVFPTSDSAAHFIKNTLVKIISKIVLHWSNIRIDPLTPGLAFVGAAFHEDLTDASGKKLPQDGYFTAIAQKTKEGWKLRNAHWSSKNVVTK
jgi:hypothetical protein